MSLSEDDPEEMPSLPMFPDTIFPALPRLLRQVTDLMHTPQESSLVLIGSIATISSALVPVRTIYFGKTIYPNMYLFVPGPAGAGKGKLDFCFRLVKPIHKEKHDRLSRTAISRTTSSVWTLTIRRPGALSTSSFSTISGYF